MTDCNQLQTALHDAIQQRQALDDPDASCQDQCDPGDVECLKGCLKNIPGWKQQLDQQIATLENEMVLCGTWSFVVQGIVETNAHDEGSLSITGILSGTLDLPDSTGNAPVTDSYDTAQGTIELCRPLSDHPGSIQDYTGLVDVSTQPPSLQGHMRIDSPQGTYGPGYVYDWSAHKQS